MNHILVCSLVLSILVNAVLLFRITGLKRASHEECKSCKHREKLLDSTWQECWTWYWKWLKLAHPEECRPAEFQ